MREHAGELVAPALLVVTAIGASVLLVPGERELALIHYKAREFAAARESYQRLLAEGDLSVGVVKPLMELHLQYGDVDAAVRLLERFVEENPDDVEARRTLGTYYQYAERQDAYRRNLEALTALELGPEVLRDLSRIYSARGELEAQVGVLETLTERFPGNDQELVDLAYLEARLKRFDEAIGTLDRLGERHPSKLTDEIIELKLNLLLDSGQPRRALAEAEAWLGLGGSAGSAARYADLFAFKGEPESAIALLRPYEGALEEHPALLSQWAQLQMRTGGSGAAFARLHRLFDAGRLPAQAAPAFVELALANGERRAAFATAFDVETRALPEWLLTVLVDTARAEKDLAASRALLERLDENYFDRRPLARAGLLLASGQRSAAALVADAIDRGSLPPESVPALAALLEELGRPREAFDVSIATLRDGRLPEDWIEETARLAVSLDEAESALPLFEAARGRPAGERAWALVAARAGEASAVARWLAKAPPGVATEALLLDLFYVAEATGAAELALASATTLHARAPDARERRWLLGRALVQAGEPLRALETLRALPPTSADEKAAYLAALERARKLDPSLTEELTAFLRVELASAAGESELRGDLALRLVEAGDDVGALPALRELAARRPVEWLGAYADTATRAGAREELLGFLEEQLASLERTASERETLAYALVERGGSERALPHLRELAETRGGSWSHAYAEALQRAGREGELTAFWRRRARSSGASPTERREAAYRLVEQGERELARRVFLELAREAPPESSDVSELLFLEGASPAPETLDWLEARGRVSAGEERAAWMRHLVAAGAPRRAASIPEASETSLAVLDARVEALASARLGSELHETAEKILGRERDPERLRRLARLAFEADELQTTRRALEKLLSLAPADPGALKQLGLVAFMSADYSEARRFLSSYHTSGAADYESEYYYGEVLLRDGRAHEARYYYGRALERLEALRAPAFTERVTEAQLLHRLGRHRESFEKFDALLREAPSDAHLRADYASALLEREDFATAERLLAEASPESERGPGALRLRLLEANLLVRTLRAETALTKLEELARSYGDNASVAASRASAAESAGRWMDALAELDRAASLAPENEDILEARAALHGRHAPALGGETRQRRLGNGERQDVVSLSGEARLARSLRLGLSLRSSEARALFAGEIVSGRSEHAALVARHDRPSGTWLEGGLHLVEGAPGTSFELGAQRVRSESVVNLDFGLPYWDLPAGTVSGAVRDRLRASRRQTFDRRFTGELSAALSRYRLPDGPGLFRSFALSGNATYRLRLANPTFSIQYLLDAESVQPLMGGAGPLPLVSREVHGVGAIASAGLTRRLRSDAVAGYAWDRLGGAAPFFGLHLSYELPEDLVARFSFERRLVAVDTAFAETYWSATFHWRF